MGSITHDLATEQTGHDRPVKDEIKVPIGVLRFGRLPVPGRLDPEPGVNTIEVRPASYQELPNPGQLFYGPAASVISASLKFQALAPVVLVHGWTAGPWVFGPTPPHPGKCRVDEYKPEGGQNFVQALIDAKIPYDCQVWLDDSKLLSIEAGSAQLAERLPQVARRFGTTRVHLVAHSKGGLWVRDFLAQQDRFDPSQRVGVLSVTTLDTPHHGSAMADYLNRTTP